MNGKIKIFSKANMLDQYLKMTLVLALTVLLSIFFNNSFIFGEMIMRLTRIGEVVSSTVKISFFALLGIASYALLVPFKFARDMWFYENSKKNKQKLKMLFSYYNPKKSLRAIKIVLLVQIRKLLITFLFLTPFALIGAYILYSLKDGIGQRLLAVLVISDFLLLITGTFFSFVFSQRYFLAPYLFYENEPCSAREVIKLSAEIMEEKCFETAFLKISFFPWMLLYIFIFPAAYVYPYYKLSVSYKALTLLIKR